MAPRIKIDSKLTNFGAKFGTLNTTFRPDSTGLDHGLVVACGLTQILAEAVGQTHWNWWTLLGHWALCVHEQYQCVKPRAGVAQT